MEELLTCKYLNCNKFFHIPIRLPCDNSLCESHLKELYQDENMTTIKCYFCNSDHKIPNQTGHFPINYDLKKLLSLNLHLSEKQKEAIVLNDKYNKMKIDIKFLKSEPETFIYDYFSQLREKIDLHREKLIHEICSTSAEMVDKLKLIEKDCMLNANRTFSRAIDESEIKSNFDDELRKPGLTDQSLNDIINEINKNTADCQVNLENLKNEFLNYKLIEFVPSKILEDRNDLFGQLNIRVRESENLKNNEISQFNFMNFDGHSSNITVMKIIDDNKYLISGSADNTIKIWDIETGVCNKTLKSHTDELTCLKYLNIDNENIMISGSWDFSIKLWDIEKSICKVTLLGHTDCVTVLRFDSAKKKLISGSLDGSIKLWNITTGLCLKTLNEHKGGVLALKITNNGILISGSMDNNIKLWNLANGFCISTLRSHSNSVECLKFLNNGKLISGSSDCTIKLWDLEKKNCIKTLVGHLDRIGHIKWIKDKQLLVSGSDDNTIKLWDIDRGICMITLRGHSDRIQCLKLHNSSYLTSSSRDCLIKIWDINNFSCLNTLTSHRGIVRKHILIDKNRLVSGSDDNTIKLWKIKLN